MKISLPAVPWSWPAGLALASVTLASVAIAPYFPGWGNGMLCLLLGMALGNFWPSPWTQPGPAGFLRWNEKNMLAWATILLGFELQTHFLAGIPLAFVPAVCFSVLGAVVFGELLARRSQQAAQVRMLAAGNAICGNSAVAAVQPMLGASPAQIGVAVTLINALGLLATLLLGPAASLLGLDATEKAVLMGSLLQSVGHVSAAASSIGDGPALLAMSLKMGRILLLIPLLLWFQGLRNPSKPNHPSGKSTFSQKITLLREIPYYVGGFVLCALATNLIPWPDWFLSSTKNLTQWMLWIALAAIGMNIRIAQVLQQGRGALVPALGMFIFQILLVLGWLLFLRL